MRLDDFNVSSIKTATVSNSSSPSRVYIRLCKHGKPFSFVQTVRTLNLDSRPTPDHQKKRKQISPDHRIIIDIP